LAASDLDGRYVDQQHSLGDDRIGMMIVIPYMVFAYLLSFCCIL
jgi:hypothetical protein